MANTRKLTVITSTRLTPNMQRVVLGGDALYGFPPAQEGAYIKLLFSDHPSSQRNKPAMRTYTVRAFDMQKQQLTIDFALHHDSEGPASRWAVDAQPGDTLFIAGPGPAKRIATDVDQLLLIGDMTSLPAIAANLEQLPEDAVGQVIVEIVSDADRQLLQKPAGIDIHWFINPNYHKTPGALAEQVKAINWPDATTAVWCACEFHSMREIRRYLRETHTLEKQNLYISSYWKIGRSEDQHKQDKTADQQLDNQQAS